MALPSLASVAELEARLGNPVPEGAQLARAEALLSDASTLVRHHAGRTWVDAEGELDDPPDIAVTIALASAVRAWFNPADIQSQSMGAVSVRYRDVWLTKAEIDRVESLAVTGFNSIDMTHGYGFDGFDTYYAPVDYGGKWIPWEEP